MSGQSALMQPHDGYRHLAAALAAAAIAPADPERQPLAEARRAAEAYYGIVARGPHPALAAGDHCIAGPAGSYRLRLYRPAGPPPAGPLPLLLYAHGGGYVLNGIDTHDGLLRDLAGQGGFAVCALGYSRAPEHRYPNQLNEALHALDWLTAKAPDLSLDAGRVVLAGDSAGAHLVLSAALALARRGRPAPRGLILAYGMYDPALESRSCREFAEGYGLTTARMRWFWDQLLPPGCRRADPDICPLRAPLEGIAPTLVVTAGLDCLRDDSLALARRLAAAGEGHRLLLYEDMLHSFLMAPAWLPPARAAIAEMAAFARNRLEE